MTTRTETRIGYPSNTGLSTIVTMSLCVPTILACCVRILCL